MEIKKLNLNNAFSGNIMKGRQKSGLLHKTEQNKINTELNKPADQQGYSGFERSYGKNNISFKGDPKLVQNIAVGVLEKQAGNIPKWATKMGGANWFKKLLHSVDKNEAAYEAAVALIVAGMLKPICVLAMPGAEREDKEMAATKNAVSAGIGFVISNLILGPCSDAVNKITKSFDTTNPTKYIKDQGYINQLKDDVLVGSAKSTLGESFKSSFKKFADLGVSPLKAGITIALTPVVLNLLFKKDEKKKAKKMAPMDNPINDMAIMNSIRIDASKKPGEMAAITPIAQTNQAVQTNKSTQADKAVQTGKTNETSFKGNVSFKGDKVSQTIKLVEKTAEKAKNDEKNILLKAKDRYNDFLGKPLAKLFGKAATTKPAQWVVEKASHFEKVSPRWSDLASVAITFFYVNNTRKSEKIDEERKLPLMINNVMVTAGSSAAAFLLDKYTDKPMENLLKSYLIEHEAELHNKSNINIKSTLDNALKCDDAELNKINIGLLMKDGAEIVGKDNEKVKGMTENLQDAIKALKNDGTVKEAIKKGLIKAEDIEKMAVVGFSQQASQINKNMFKTKSLTIFTITVRFLVTVLMTPLIGRVVALVNKKLGKESGDSKGKDKSKDKTIPPAGSETIGMKDYMDSLNK